MAEEEQSVPEHASKSESIPLGFEQLGLTPEEIAHVKQQGFVSREQRGGKTTIFKLRFRMNGRQRTKYLGSDAERATILEQQLTKLQTARGLNKKLRVLNRAAAELLRATKSRLAPLVGRAGLRFHGRVLRRTRRVEVEGTV